MKLSYKNILMAASLVALTSVTAYAADSTGTVSKDDNYGVFDWRPAKGRYRISIGPDSATRPVVFDFDEMGKDR